MEKNDEPFCGPYRATIHRGVYARHQPLLFVGTRGKPERHSDPTSQKGISPYRLSVVSDPVRILWRLLLGRFARGVADGTHGLQEGASDRITDLRVRCVFVYPGGFDWALRVFPFRLVWHGLWSWRSGSRRLSLRHHSQ